jgi:hypothetical protein
VSNVLRHPNAAADPVINPKRRGRRPSNVVTLRQPMLVATQPVTPPSNADHRHSGAHIVLRGGEVVLSELDLPHGADSFEMLLQLWLLMGKAFRGHLDRIHGRSS